SFLENSPLATLDNIPGAMRELPETIGPYRIVGLLGQGGMGVVYRAREQRPPREIALKVIRSCLIEPALLRRFEHEADALARLSHPGIAAIHAVGSAELNGAALPYIAMELVEGEPCTQYCKSRDVPVAARLELFARICDAIQHAHERAVIHRDLKPANVL